jgi:hypothetical protein
MHPLLLKFTLRPAHLLRLLLVLGGGVFASAKANAQAIVTWETAHSIAGDGDVLTAGAGVFAHNFGLEPSTVSVNGVTFDAFGLAATDGTSVSLGSVTLAESEVYLSGRADLGSTESPFSALSGPYQTLLATGATTTFGNTFTVSLTLNDLTVGHDYAFQWWSNDSTGNYSSTIADDGAEHQLGLAGGLGPDGYVGKFGIGTFTATETSQAFFFNGNDSYPLINAFQLRDVSAIPEPSTYAMCAAAAALGCAVLRRRQSLRRQRGH